MIYFALENIRSLHNVGAIFRTCSFFGIENVLLVGFSGKMETPGGNVFLHEKVEKTSLGSHEDLNIEFLGSSDELITLANERNLKIIAVEQTENSTPLHKFNLEDNIIFVFGNEVEGVSKEIIENSVGVVEVSRHGKHNSLNVATTVGVVAYHVVANL